MLNRPGFTYLWIVGVLLLSTGAVAQIFASNPTANAAVKYLRADLSLRQAYALKPDAWVELQRSLSEPIDSIDDKLIEAAGEALTEFGHGAALQACDWQMSTDDGPLASTAQRGAIRELASVAGLRARLRFRSGQAIGAITDVTNAIAASRHLTTDTSVASTLFGYKLERDLSFVALEGLPTLSRTELALLQQRLGSEPSGSDMQLALRQELIARDDLARIASSAHDRADLIHALVDRVPVLKGDQVEAAALVEGCGGTVTGFRKCLDQRRAFYERWVARFNLPPGEFQQLYLEEASRMKATNVLAARFMLGLDRLRWIEARQRTHRALVLAAVAVQQNGPEVLRSYKDPYDGHSFVYSKLPDGFQLASSLQDDGKPLRLTVHKNENAGH